MFGFIAFNVVRGFLGASGSGSDNPITVPAPTAYVVVPPPDFTIDPNLRPGTVQFGSAAGTNCGVARPATSFALGTGVWWSASLGVAMPAVGRVTWQVARDGSIVASGTGPGDSPASTWDVLCGNDPIAADAAGTYVLRVLDETGQVVLSVGQFTVGGSGPGPSLAATVGVIDFGSGRAADCEPTGRGTTFPLGTSVWWLAHLGSPQAKGATVTWVVTRNGTTVTGGKGPRDFQPDAWTALCGNGPILSVGPGTYVVTVLDSTGQTVLATGAYTLGGS